MTKGYGAGALPDIADELSTNKEAEDCLLPMGITSENVAKDFGITREAQDRFAVSSFQKAATALKAGKFRAEIVPIKTKIIDPKTENAVEIVVDADDGIRDGVTFESLAKLKPAFTKDGSTHAGMSVSSWLIRRRAECFLVQEMLHKCLMELLRCSSREGPSPNASDYRSWGNTSPASWWVFRRESWASDQPLLYPKRSRRRA